MKGKMDPSLSVSALQADRTTKEGSFELHLSIDEEKVSIRIQCDFQMDRHYFYTTTATKGTVSGHKLNEYYPALADALRRSIDLFVFDGELARDMLTDGVNSADDAIEALYRTDTFKDLVREIESLKRARKQRNRDVTTASEQSAVDKLEREFNEAKDVLDRLEQEKSTLERGIRKIDKRVKEIDDRCRELGFEDDEFRLRQQDIEDRSTKARNDIERLAPETVFSFRSPLSLHSIVEVRLSALNSTLKKRRLPRSSKSFFEELAKEETCICGDALDDAKRKHILLHAEDHLGDEQVSVINDIRYKLSDTVDRPEFSAQVTKLSEAEDKYTSVAQERERLDLEKIRAGKEEVEALTSEKDALVEDRILKSQALKFLTEEPVSLEDVDWKRNLRACDALKRDREQAFNIANSNNRYFSAADKLALAANRARTLSKERLQAFVRDQTNSRLNSILDNNNIRVSRIDGRLHLVDEEKLPKDGASEGQKLAVCYAFLTALLAEAPARLPFIVDSPAVSLDLDLRKNVGKLIPKIFDQLIVFVISSEREGFADAFKGREDTQFLTASIDQQDGSVEIDANVETFFRFQSVEAIQ
ncbi:hypothetical protein ATO11_20880 [Pseudaestuariivita atlantica]|uniref:Rad50/SbcC-type AAA domain-containing protein n=2 Tax=Pseudaestuariivita atlantica TaxID=1317121 RepID=A0A0L1JK43_9RHOB|nr:hypothetical protein ATO11_20880 [Pseudaestuariivita atlantica]